MEGWIKLHRKLQNNKFWTCEKFTRGQAWVDLLLLANHEYGFFYKRGVKIEIQRGQVGVSEIGLANRWQWSRSKVRKFLNDLEKEQQIIQQKSNITQIVTIINYNEYQQKEQQLIQQKDSRKTAERQQKDTNKNNKEEEKNKKELRLEREQLFKKEISEFKDKYSTDMLRSFFAYWSEPNKAGDKMRFELQKTWDVQRRLITWFNRDKK